MAHHRVGEIFISKTPLGRPYIPRGAKSTIENMARLRRLIWRDLIEICEDPAHRSFPFYGAKGIIVAREWKKYLNFSKDLGPIPNGVVLTLEPRETRFALGTCKWTEVNDEANRTINDYLPDFLRRGEL
jgi:hypothetical protein